KSPLCMFKTTSHISHHIRKRCLGQRSFSSLPNPTIETHGCIKAQGAIKMKDSRFLSLFDEIFAMLSIWKLCIIAIFIPTITFPISVLFYRYSISRIKQFDNIQCRTMPLPEVWPTRSCDIKEFG